MTNKAEIAEHNTQIFRKIFWELRDQTTETARVLSFYCSFVTVLMSNIHFFNYSVVTIWGKTVTTEYFFIY